MKGPWLRANAAITAAVAPVVPGLNNTDVSTDVEISDNLADWNSGPGYTVTVQDRDDLLVVRDAVPISTGPHRSMRLRVRAP